MNPIKYTILRRPRRKTASIVVKPDRTVQIIVPAKLGDNEIKHIAETKRQWVVDKLAELENCELDRVEYLYEDGEKYLFMGKPLTLCLTDGREEVIAGDSSIIVAVPMGLANEDRCEYIRKKILFWFTAEAEKTLRKKSYFFGKHCGLHPIYVSIKEYKSRWGCCFSDGRIYFNWKIIFAPEHIIDYVVIHELCHLSTPNHSKEYWQLVEKIVPDWKDRRKWLRRNGHCLTI